MFRLGMGFVEFLRVRKALAIYAIVLAIGATFIVGSIEYGLHQARHGIHVHVAHKLHGALEPSTAGQGSSTGISPGGGKEGEKIVMGPKSLADLKFDVPLAWITGLAVFSVMIFAMFVSTSLNKENGRGGFAFTKPISRERLAIGYMATDAAAILIAYLYTIAVILLCFAALGITGKIVVDSSWLPVTAAGLGATFMWYGLLQAITGSLGWPGGLFAGLSWPVFSLAAALYQVDFFGPIFHAAIAVVDFFNPFAYFGISSSNDSVSSLSLFGFSTVACIAITWSVAFVACAVAIFEWKRVEV